MVTLTELLPNIRILAEDLDVSKNQEQTYFEPYKTYYLHTPQFEAGAAAILMQALAEASQEN